MKKKIISMLLALVMVLSVVSCSKDSGKSNRSNGDRDRDTEDVSGKDRDEDSGDDDRKSNDEYFIIEDRKAGPTLKGLDTNRIYNHQYTRLA